jgi:hypothetical protein
MKFSSSKSQNKLAPEEALLVLYISLKHDHTSISRQLHSVISGFLEPFCALNLLPPSMLDPMFPQRLLRIVNAFLTWTYGPLRPTRIPPVAFSAFPRDIKIRLLPSSNPKTHPLLTLPLSDDPFSVGKKEPPLASEMNTCLPGCSICMPCHVVEMLAR